MPRPSHTCEEGLVFWATFLVTWSGADLGFEITNQIAEDLIIIAWRKRPYLKGFGNSENLSRSLFSAVPIDIVAISSFCKLGCIVVHMDWGVRNSTSGFKNTIMTLLTKYGPASCDKKCHSEHQTLFPLFGEGLGMRLGIGNVQTELELTADIENSSIRCFPTLRTCDRSRDETKVSK